MTAIFAIAALVALVTTALAITRANAVHALLYFVVSLVAMAVIFFALGAPFAAALEIIVYAGAIVVLFLFVVMMLSLDRAAALRESSWMAKSVWVLPVIFIGLLGFILAHSLFATAGGNIAPRIVTPQQVGTKLFTIYLPSVELASMLLLAGLIGAFHLGRKP